MITTSFVARHRACCRGHASRACSWLGHGWAWPSMVGRLPWPPLAALRCGTPRRCSAIPVALLRCRYCWYCAVLLLVSSLCARGLAPLPYRPRRCLAIYGTTATQAVLGRRRVCVVHSVSVRVTLVVLAVSRQDKVASSSSFPLFSLPPWPTKPRKQIR